ncbi:hypothetical protein CBS101457_005526 [Exobasidium rhododendri]|nr:hypothetical protein CBS101457_005526 [Exobasidium rhododendri]
MTYSEDSYEVLASRSGSPSHSGDAKRPLQLSTASTQIRIPVPVAPYEAWIAAVVLRDDFHRASPSIWSEAERDALAVKEEIAEEDEEEEEEGQSSSIQKQAKKKQKSLEARLILTSKFLSFLASKIEVGKKATSTHEFKVLESTWHYFNKHFLGDAIDVHKLVSPLDVDVRSLVLCSYYEAFVLLDATNAAVPGIQTPKLLTLAQQGGAELFALFGGQGSNEVYFNELQGLYDTYRPLISPLLEAATRQLELLSDEASAQGFSSYYTHGLNVIGWLSGAQARPTTHYLGSIPLSLPLIGLTQLTQYLVACRASGLSPGEFRSRIKGSTGHSQGVISALVLAVSDSYENFVVNTVKALGLLFHIGKRGQESFPELTIEPALVNDAVEGGEGEPSPMLSVNGLSQVALEKFIKSTNSHLEEGYKVDISLFNGPRNFIVTGPPRSLFGLVGNLRAKRAESGADQTRVPFSKRKPVFNMRFLPVGVPYHSTYLQGATEKVTQLDYQGSELWQASELKTTVRNTFDGSDMSQYPDSQSLLQSVCDQIFVQHIYWLQATDVPATTTACLDFGTGGLSGIGSLTARNLEGRGVRTIIVSGVHPKSAELYDIAEVQNEKRWIDDYRPKLVKTLSGEIKIDTLMSRVLGKPPICVGGMTPSTVQAGINAAVANAGYHIELAGGGQIRPNILRSRVEEIQSLTEAGQPLTLNCLYINQRQWSFQYPQWLEMRREGFPLNGFTVAAGVPSTEAAKTMLDGLKQAGIEHVTFKPGSVEGIRQVCNIASANPTMNIICQVTGGRAGGHHSAEDFHQLILPTYSLIRNYSNLALVAGSGFGSDEDFWPYFCGDWSVAFGSQPMPMDGVMFASRIMTAAEAHTSTPIKQLIVDAPGVDDKDWEGTYERETGGILTVTSELGEPIHKIATRGIKLWHELDKELFPLTKEKRLAWMSEKKDYLIERLNKDFQKPWFPCRKDGTAAQDVAEMTYEEVSLRLLRLLFVSHQSRWIDLSLRNLVGDWLRRCEERFAGINTGGEKISLLQNYSCLDKEPKKFIETFFEEYPDGKSLWLAAEDVSYFIAICGRPGQKPVPFIPVLDENFPVFFKRDSLWFSEDLDAVFDQDPQRVCILQGPMAVRHSKIVNEPVKDILGGVEKGLIKRLLERYYDNDESKVPTLEYLSKAAPHINVDALLAEHSITATSTQGGGVRSFQVGSSVPRASDWLEVLAGPKPTWLRALLRSVSVVQGRSYIDNPISRMLSPRKGQTAEITYSSNGEPKSLRMFGAARSFGVHDPSFKAIEITKDSNSSLISVQMFEERLGDSIPLLLQFHYRPDQPFALIHEVMEGRNDRIKSFYWQLWFHADIPTVRELSSRKEHVSPMATLDSDAIIRFCQIVENRSEAFHLKGMAPMDFAIVAGWQGIMQALIASTDADLLSLVHLSNAFKLVEGATPLRAGDQCSAKASIQSIKISDTGKTVAVRGVVLRLDAEDGAMKPVIEVVSSFFFRGRFKDFDRCFETVSNDYQVLIKSAPDIAVLLSKEWFTWTHEDALKPNTSLEIHITSDLRFKDSTSFSAVDVEGTAYVRDFKDDLLPVGEIQYSADSISHGNPVAEYIKRIGGSSTGPVALENGYSLVTGATPATFKAPSTNEPYSKVSGDFNPIHINPYFSQFASLPSTITHGLFSSAATRRFVEDIAAEGHPERCLSFEANFLGMISPGDELQVKLRHVAMRNGNKVIKVETFNQHGDKVLEGQAEVAQPPTVYVFTGQGSQSVGMGMDLYNSSETARALWDEADAHLKESMGFSILEIVNKNPLNKTVHFGGVRGLAIRDRYMAMTYESTDEKGNVIPMPLFPEITSSSQSYTFSHPQGLLNATHFTQPALVLTELSAFRDMQRRGLIVENAPFCGHSLGEYAAIAGAGSALDIKDLCDIVFLRGLTMQRAVKRDEQGRSDFGMVACNAARVGLSDQALMEVVYEIARRPNCFLEPINFNVTMVQTVVAGNLIGLRTLQLTLDKIAEFA